MTSALLPRHPYHKYPTSRPTGRATAPACAMRLCASLLLAARLASAAAAASASAGLPPGPSSILASEWMAPKRAASILFASVRGETGRRG